MKKKQKKNNQNMTNEPPLLPHPRSNDPNILLAEFTYNFSKMLNKYFPLIKISRKKFKEKNYITNEIKSMIKKRNDLHHIYIHDRSEINKEN